MTQTNPNYELVPHGSLMQLSACRELIVLEDCTHTLEFVILENEAKAAYQALLRKRDQLHSMQARIQSLNVMMTRIFADLTRELAELDLQKLALINPEEANAQRNFAAELEKDRVKAELDERNRQEEIAAAERKKRKGMDRNRTARCKFLYQQISQACHPDRTDDPQLHEILVPAQKFYEQNDLEVLEQLMKALSDYRESKKNPDWFRTNIAQRKANAMRKLIEMSQSVAECKNSQGYKLVAMVDNMQVKEAKAIYHQLMLNRKDELQNEIEQIKQALAEKARQEAAAKQFQTAGSYIIVTTFNQG